MTHDEDHDDDGGSGSEPTHSDSANGARVIAMKCPKMVAPAMIMKTMAVMRVVSASAAHKALRLQLPSHQRDDDCPEGADGAGLRGGEPARRRGRP